MQFFIIALNDLRERTEETFLSIRKERLENLFSSKRKITKNDKDNNKKYQMSVKELNIPSDFEININKYYQNVILY